MAQTRDLRFTITGDDSGASKAFNRAGKFADGFGKKLAGIGKGAALGGLGAVTVGVGALAAGLFQGFKDAAALQTILAKTNAVIKSTGGVAGVSAKGVRTLADDLESLSGIDGDAIINAQNLLLTFTNVRNGVGEMNHVFDQATKTAVDMAAALGSDPTQAAMQLGKALNDPIKGVSALSKVGVSFTEKQKKTIKTLVDSGKAMEAQKVILKELQVEFGGAAKAAGSGFEGAMARAKDAIGDAFRDTATPLLPEVTKQLERFSTFINTKGAPAILNFIEEFKKGEGPGGRFRDRMREIGDKLRAAAPHVKTMFDKISQLVGWMMNHEGAVKTFAAAIAGYAVAVRALAAAGAVAAAVKWAGIATGIATVGTAAGTGGAVAGVGAFSGALGAIPFAATVAGLAGLIYWFNRVENSKAALANAAAGYPTVTTGPKQAPRNNPLQGRPPINGVNVDLDKPLYAPRPVQGPRAQPARPINGPSRNNQRLMTTTVINLDGKHLTTVVNGHNGAAKARGGTGGR